MIQKSEVVQILENFGLKKGGLSFNRGFLPWWEEIRVSNLEKCKYLNDTVLWPWFNMHLKEHCMAVLTHFQQMSYDIFSLLYRPVIRCCILLLGTVYTGSELIEISEPINVMKIFLGSFLFVFSYWCVGRLWFFYWRNDWNQEYLSDTLNIFVKCTEKISGAFENNKQVSAETKNLCQNFQPHF